MCNNFGKIVSVFLSISGCFSVNCMLQVKENSNFKLGIELQETSGLCPIALRDDSLQKKSIFKAIFNNSYIWHVEIDGNDIEFVTQPFTNRQFDELQFSMSSITKATTSLNEMGKRKFSFQDWINHISTILEKDKVHICEINDLFMNLYIEIPCCESWCPKFTPHVTIQHPLEWTMLLYSMMFMSYSEDPETGLRNLNSPCSSMTETYIKNTLPFQNVLKSEFSKEKSNANLPKISNTSSIKEQIHNLSFIVDITKESQDLFTLKRLLAQLYRDKMLNLMFLTAMTMETIGFDNNCLNNIDLLLDTYRNNQKLGQFDAKIYLDIMSRRPLSDLYRDIGGDDSVENLIPIVNLFSVDKISNGSKYIDVFSAIMMTEQNKFNKNIKSFCNANYGDQYYDNEGKVKDLSFLLEEKYNKDFFSEQMIAAYNRNLNINCSTLMNKTPSPFVFLLDFNPIVPYGAISPTAESLVKSLLKDGIITTTILRNMLDIPAHVQQYFREDYYKWVLNSISNPVYYETRPVISIKNGALEFDAIRHPYDLLSPPVFFGREK